MIDLPFTRPGHVVMARLAELGERLVELTAQDERLTREQCSVRLERGDVLNQILAEGGDEALGELVQRSGLSEQQAGQERWVSGKVPDYARNPETFSWAAHREVAGLEPEQQVEVFEEAERTGQTSQRGVREIVRAMFGSEPDGGVADPSDQDWPGFLRMALVQHFAGRLSDALVGEMVTQVTRFQREWEKAQERLVEGAA